MSELVRGSSPDEGRAGAHLPYEYPAQALKARQNITSEKARYHLGLLTVLFPAGWRNRDGRKPRRSLKTLKISCGAHHQGWGIQLQVQGPLNTH